MSRLLVICPGTQNSHFLAVNTLIKQAISWLFILGTVFHSGMLYLALLLGQDWAMQMVKLGPPLLLLGLLVMAGAAAIGFKGQVVHDP